jgi:predicted nucleotidyltransferase component of viral defense system
MTEPGVPLDPLELQKLRRSLSAKLRNEARDRGTAPDYIRKQYVFAIFFNRLFSKENSGWLLLGGNALLVRIGGGRFTKDIDLARDEPWEDPDAVLAELQALTGSTAPSDPFRFDLHKITPHREADAYGYGTTTATISVKAILGSTEFETFSIDVTSRRHVTGPVDQVRPQPIIDHETLEDLCTVPVVPIENHLADKLCAMYELHSNGPSTRYRDLADVVRIVQKLTFDAKRLAAVLAHEMQRRKMTPPDSITAPDSAWASAYPRAAATFAEFPKEYWPLEASLKVAANCLDDVLTGAIKSGQWHPEDQVWR